MSEPSVVLGTESWLNDEIRDDEVFPVDYMCYRKDRNGHGGGVFILVKSDIVSSNLDVVVGTCEAVWCQLELANKNVITVCSCYRAPDFPIDVMSQLASAIDEVHSDFMIIGGDFNLPNIHWHEHSTTISPSGASAQKMINISSLHALHQMVLQPTRENTILDLIFTNQFCFVTATYVLPGISDHDAVLCKMNYNTLKHQCATKGAYRIILKLMLKK